MSNIIPYVFTPIARHNRDVFAGELSDSLLSCWRTEVQHLMQINIDNSGSTYGSGGIDEVYKVLPGFLSDLQADSTIRSSVVGAFAVFDDDCRWRYAGPFAPVTEMKIPEFKPTGATWLCQQLIESIERLSAKRKLIRNVLHADQRNAWLIAFTDGKPSDAELLKATITAVRETAVANGIEVHLFGMGEGADMNFLHSIEQPGRPASELAELNYKRVFEWLVTSLRAVSRSMKGERLEIPSVTGQIIRTE